MPSLLFCLFSILHYHSTFVTVSIPTEYLHLIEKMNNCTSCGDCFRNDHPNKIICDGNCRQSFHADCVNFSKEALLCYREMPNLQCFCDSCIIQARSSNISSPLFNKFNSTAVIPTSSPSSVQCSVIAAKSKRNRNRNSIPNV